MTTLIEILYSSTEGQARQIAMRISSLLREAGFDTQVENVRNAVMLHRPAALIMVASIHVGKHAGAATAFVRNNLDFMKTVPSAFMSVSLSASEADKSTAKGYVDDFLAQTGWKPDLTTTVAGALRYTQYSFVKKFVIRKIAKENGLPTDTSRDHEFTDWDEVASFVNAFEGMLRAGVSTV